ncbi:MAG: hypothetical protein ACRDA5_05155 [Clostridium sp.]
MKKLRLITIIKVIYILLAIGGIITFLIVYKNVDSKIAIKFVVGYVLFLFLSVLYMMGMSLYTLRKLKWFNIKKRLVKFIMVGLALSTLNYCMDYLFMPERIYLIKNISIGFGLAFGIYFLIPNEKGIVEEE